MARFAVTTCMHDRIADTLRVVAKLSSPVARSCHFGNNTSNVWGWLAIGKNTKVVQYDHTRYALDENCIPWVVLGARGRILACYDHNGIRQPIWEGRPINQHLRAIDRRYAAHLNYGIHAAYEGEDLILHHCRLAATLSAQMNGSTPSFDSAELLSIAPKIRELIGGLVDSRSLHLAFDRWIRATRKKNHYVISYTIDDIQYPKANQVNIIDHDGNLAFSGSADALWHCLMEGMDQVSRRLTCGHPVTSASYPWFTLELSYLIQSIKEFDADPSQRRFWHAAGSSSQYYINQSSVRLMFNEVRDILVRLRHLPEGATLSMIPTYCCQLFATNHQALSLLEDITESWRNYLDVHRSRLCRSLLSLGRCTRSFEVGRRAHQKIESAFLCSLDRKVSAFNQANLNSLPVAHVAHLNHPTYNKFGCAQFDLLEVTPLFPAGFREMTWAEAELLVKIIAHIRADRPE